MTRRMLVAWAVFLGVVSWLVFSFIAWLESISRELVK